MQVPESRYLTFNFVRSKLEGTNLHQPSSFKLAALHDSELKVLGTFALVITFGKFFVNAMLIDQNMF